MIALSKPLNEAHEALNLFSISKVRMFKQEFI